MARPRLGKAAKSNVASVRMTDAEKEALTAKYGSPAKALRTLINKDLQGAQK